MTCGRRSAHVCGSVVVFISGCFDMLHAGHVEFFQGAAALGDHLYVALGSDKTVYDLKGRPPINTEGERCFMMRR